MRNTDLGCLRRRAIHQHLSLVVVALKGVGTKPDPQLLDAGLDSSDCTVHQNLSRLNEQVKLGIISVEMKVQSVISDDSTKGVSIEEE